MITKPYKFVILVLMTAIFAGCDLFSTRSVEAPESGRSSWETPRIPSDVLINLSNALFERNTVNYLRSFDSDIFLFEADNVTLASDPSMQGWSYEDESSHINSLLSSGTLPRDSSLFVSFNTQSDIVLNDSAEIVASYELLAGVVLAGAPGQMAGTAHYYLHMGAEGYWQIYRWRDTRTESHSTWSDLKSLIK